MRQRTDLPNCLIAGLESQPSWRTPLDERDLAVRLESDGVTDEVSQVEFGFTSVQHMAQTWHSELKHVPDAPAAAERATGTLALHLRGISFALPLALCSAVMILLGYSLWGGDFDAGVAAAVALGTVGSLMVTGGVVQSMAWQGLFYAGSGDFRMSLVTCKRWCGYGIVTLASTAAAWVLLNRYFAWLEAGSIWLAVGFYIALGLLWMSTGILYMVEQHALVTVAIAVGIESVVILHAGFGFPLIGSQIASVFLAALFAFFAGFRFLQKRNKDTEDRVQPRMLGRTIYATSPYFLYGFLYYLLLFADRLIAWTANTGSAASAVVFRGNYELPLDIALIGFVFSAGWVQVSTHAFYQRIRELLPQCGIQQADRFNRALQQFHFKRLTRFIPLAYAANTLVWIVASRTGLLHTGQARWIAAVALAAYPWLAAGLWNVSLLFALSLPRVVVPVVGAAVVADIGCGYVLTRVVSYDLAVFGFLLGAVIFGVGTWMVVNRYFRRLDYFYFAAGT